MKWTPIMDYHKETSFPDLSYPSLRDGGLQTAGQWLNGKVLDDGAEGLWRIHDKLYDFSDFMKRHPGGEKWLLWTKGTDITEAFETHHITLLPESMLEKFFVKDAVTKRHSPFTFKPDGFYKTLKSRAREELKKIPPGNDSSSKRIMDLLLLAMFVFAIATCYTDWIWWKVSFCILGGLFMNWAIICAHNFTHQKDNWRMYIFNFSFIPTRDWRVTHGLSHHLFPNTLLDHELHSYEPFFMWLPRDTKPLWNRYGPRIYAVLVYVFVFDILLIKAFLKPIFAKSLSTFDYEDLIPFSLPLAMYFFGNSGRLETLMYWVIIWHVASLLYNMIGLNAAHHHPDIFHDGDKPREDRDWGIHQLHAVMDRVDITGSHFKVLTNFGDHGLHHMFPAIDHAILPKLRQVFLDTCEEFHTKLRETTQLELIIGQFRQLARTERNVKEFSQ